MNELREQKAQELWEEGTDLLLAGEVDDAIDTFTRSIEFKPSAEAYTFRAWARSFKDEIEEAIDDCRKAISTDPSFGNPYNDIGCYLMQLGRNDEAIPWLEKAKKALRYEPRHFPYLNLGRLYQSQGMLVQALAEFKAAERIAPEDTTARAGIESLRPRIN